MRTGLDTYATLGFLLAILVSALGQASPASEGGVAGKPCHALRQFGPFGMVVIKAC